MSQVIEIASTMLKGRLAELDSEKARIEKAIAELSVNGKPKKRGPGRPPGSGGTGSKGPKAKARRGGRKGGATRRDQALKLIQDTPGIGATAIAKALKIKPNYLYRVLGELEKENLVAKNGREYTARSAV